MDVKIKIAVPSKETCKLFNISLGRDHIICNLKSPSLFLLRHPVCSGRE